MEKTFIKGVSVPENCTKVVLDNGLKIFITEKKNFNTNYVIFGTKYGSIDTAFSKNGGEKVKVPEGIAHYLEHKLFESEDGDAFSRFSATGANANAFTSFDRTCYLFSCADRFYENLDILLDFVQNPYFTEQTVQKEQGIIGQEIRMYDDNVGWCVLFSMLGAMYKNHPVKIDIAGTVESIAKINAPLLYSCYETFYNPSNMFICVAGNVDTNKVIERIKNGIKPSTSVTIERDTFSEPDEIVIPYVEKKMEIAKPVFCFGYKEKCDGERSLKDSLCSEILLDVISGDTSPLFEELINKNLVNYEFDSEYFQGNGYATPIWQGESDNPKDVADAIKAEVERLKKDGIDDELFESARRSLYGTAIKRYNGVEGIVMGLVDCAMFDNGPYDDIKILKDLKKADVEERLKLLDPQKTVLSVVYPK